MKGITTDMPPDVVLIRADLIRVGDRVRFRMSSADYTVEEVETDGIGHVRHRTGNGTRTCGYHPGELLWITRRAQHTPGPWRYQKCPCGMNGCNQHTISVQGSVGFDEANARLIASAPDLLDALRAILTDSSEDIAGLPRDEALDLLSAIADTAREAIAKATRGAP